MSGKLGKFTKQPGETEDFDVSFVAWLAARADTIADVTVTVPTGITLVTNTEASGVVKVWLSGGTSGTIYKITVSVLTVGSRRKEAEFDVKVKEI